MRRLAGAIAVLFALQVCPARAQEGAGEDDPDLGQDIQSLLGDLGIGQTMTEQDLERRVEEAGGLKLVHPLPIRFLSKAELADYLRDLFDQEYPSEEASRESEFLQFLGLIPKGYDLRGERARLLSENIAGFYDERSSSKSLFAVSSSRQLDLMNSLILAHEVRHAIQDQHFDLASKLPDRSDFDDRKLAPLAMYEGDATYVMMRFLGTEAMPGIEGADEIGLPGDWAGDLGSLMGQVAGMAGGAYAAAPEVLQRQLLLPYIEGEKLVEALHRRGGMRAVNDALAQPPQTSEQVLHPEKYLAHESPLDLNFDASAQYRGQSLVFEGVMGEFYIQTLFPETIRETAAAGWNGDYYQLFRDSTGRRTLVWKLSWDTPRDADEFAEAWRQRASGGRLDAHEGVLEGRDTDGVPLRLIVRGADVLLIKSEGTYRAAASATLGN